MQQKNDRNLTFLIFASGIGIIVVSNILKMFFPSSVAWLPEGFSSPILAFEFLQTNREVLQFFGPASPERDAWVTGMNRGHQVDYLYLVVYGLFLASWGLLGFRKTGNKLFYGIIVLAVVAALSDLMENLQLVNIASNLDAGTFETPLKRLFLFTWLKWGSLAFALAGISVYLFKTGFAGKIYMVVSLATLVLGVIAFINRSAFTGYFTLGITVQFVFLIGWAIWLVFGVRRRKKLL